LENKLALGHKKATSTPTNEIENVHNREFFQRGIP